MAKKQTTNDSKYLNGIFFTKKDGQYGEYFSIGITDEGLEALNKLERSESGFRNFTASPQQKDPSKYSCKYSCKPYVPKGSYGAGDSSDRLPWE